MARLRLLVLLCSILVASQAPCARAAVVKVGVITAAPLSAVAAWSPPLPEGATQPYAEAISGGEFPFNAEVQPTATITSLATSSGPVSGGTAVTISGTDLGGRPLSFEVQGGKSSTPTSASIRANPKPRADARIRTADPFITNEVLYQLSYAGALALRAKNRDHEEKRGARSAPNLPTEHRYWSGA